MPALAGIFSKMINYDIRTMFFLEKRDAAKASRLVDTVKLIIRTKEGN
jgi:hypothetical protein